MPTNVYLCAHCCQVFMDESRCREHEISHTPSSPPVDHVTIREFVQIELSDASKAIFIKQMINMSSNSNDEKRAKEVLNDKPCEEDDDDDMVVVFERTPSICTPAVVCVVPRIPSSFPSPAVEGESEMESGPPLRPIIEDEHLSELEEEEDEATILPKIDVKAPLKCRYCHLIFCIPWKRLRHEACHRSVEGRKEELPLRCRHCGVAKWRNANARLRHERVHTGEKPFKCTMCPMAFSLSAPKRKHEHDTHLSRFNR